MRCVGVNSWMVVVGCSLLAASRCLSLVIVSCPLCAQCVDSCVWIGVCCCLLCVVCRSRFVVCCSLLAVRCCLLFVVRCPLFVVCCSLCVGRCALSVVVCCCLLFGIEVC